MAHYDLTIIGGGIIGTAIARDAAGRGLKVLLVEQNDLASGTSSTSSKLIHGGLRYLEQGAFKLVQEGLAERARLLTSAPHIIWPARFVLPHHTGLRPAWQLRFGLALYDMLGGNKLLPGAATLSLHDDETGRALKPEYKTAFEYSDACVDDARFVVLNAVDAAEKGATIRTRTKYESATRDKNHWKITLSSASGKEEMESKALVNASGPWMAGVKLVKGSHIVVRRLFEHQKAYIFQNHDGRIVFAIPYQGEFTLIGTTDFPFAGDPGDVQASPEEVNYLCQLVNDYFKKPITPRDVVWSFAGVRALYDNRELKAKDLSRDYVMQLEGGVNKPPLLSIYGGKLTAARHVAEVAVARLQPFFKMTAPWTGEKPLPGGDFAWNGFPDLVQKIRAQYAFLSEAQATRLARAYGTRVFKIFSNVKSVSDLGQLFGGELSEKEVRYLMQYEFAKTVDDILWRRSKLGLHLDTDAQKQLGDFVAKGGAA
jgi:glycerol-3-phosphate dehydrogenase